MRIRFQQSLEDLRSQLLGMAALAESGVEHALKAYSTRDLTECALVFRSEPEINRLEREIDRMAIDLLATEQPMAIDLRFILSIIRINGDLERVGDQAVNIAARVQDTGSTSSPELPVNIPLLGSLAMKMVRQAVQAFADGDAAKAKHVLELDDEVDAMNTRTFTTLNTLILESPAITSQALNDLIIARNLERVGDHATNIAEDVIFWVQGADVRHNAKN